MGVSLPTGGPCRTGSEVCEMWKLHCQDLTLFSIIPWTLSRVHLWVTHHLLLDTKFGKGGQCMSPLIQLKTRKGQHRWTLLTGGQHLTWRPQFFQLQNCVSELLVSITVAPVYNLHTWFPSTSLRNTICRSFRMALQSLWGKGGGIKGFGFQFVLSGVSSTCSRKSTDMGWMLMSKKTRANSIVLLPLGIYSRSDLLYFMGQ